MCSEHLSVGSLSPGPKMGRKAGQLPQWPREAGEHEANKKPRYHLSRLPYGALGAEIIPLSLVSHSLLGEHSRGRSLERKAFAAWRIVADESVNKRDHEHELVCQLHFKYLAAANRMLANRHPQ